MALKKTGVFRLGYVRLALSDDRLSKARAFYEDVIGLVETISQPHRVCFRCWHESYAASFILEEGPEDRLVEVGFEVSDEESLENIQNLLTAQGIQAVEDKTPEDLPGCRQSIRFVAPGGVPLRLFVGMEDLGYLSGFTAPDWNVPLHLRGKVAPIFFNHVGVCSEDVAATVAFLRDTLGFGVSEKIVDTDKDEVISALTFRMVSENGGQDLTIFKGPASSLHHVGFLKEDESQILTDGQYLRQMGVDIEIRGPIRQPYGATFSLYFRDPLGVRIELCAGGRLLAPHRDCQSIEWTSDQIGKALSAYDELIDESFLLPCF